MAQFDIQTQYPAANADTAALTITLTSLATSSGLVAGRESTAVSNASDEDEDHILGGKTAIQSHATPGVIEVWAYSLISRASGTPAYGKVTGSDAAVTFDSRNQLVSAMVPLWSTRTDASVARSYYMPMRSIKEAFGELPTNWGIVVVHNHGGSLSATATDHAFHYQRIRKQYNS